VGAGRTTTVVVEPSPEPLPLPDGISPVGCVEVDSSVVVAGGRVKVTVVGVAAQTVQTVTVVVQPSGISGVMVGCAGLDPEPEPEPGMSVVGEIAVAVAEAVPGQYVDVIVVVMVVKPVGQMLVYEVTMRVVVVAGSVVVGLAVMDPDLVLVGSESVVLVVAVSSDPALLLGTPGALGVEVTEPVLVLDAEFVGIKGLLVEALGVWVALAVDTVEVSVWPPSVAGTELDKVDAEVVPVNTEEPGVGKTVRVLVVSGEVEGETAGVLAEGVSETLEEE
jgi:hypothetical protein